ncbi:acyltransferase family protein [Cellulomonas sp. Leaf395]|uniref:acyltransferase family protein n=1 Tax=Cellulomonas sp. Leaf395 TaxID=1736362 RepID=UPI0006F65957|nr:acyltransferase family protein [Cellulomonas sp. Leaf395]KQS99782.1 hypothetical protein ASG23_10670 [Cellulomonas sp. Leaf395]
MTAGPEAPLAPVPGARDEPAAATAPVAPRRARRTAANPGFRSDIEGLRALAVGLVILDHALGWPVGGFIGVDVFFVISGFLITGLLYKEFRRTGHISFVGFYRRRIRRILPVSTVVLAVTVAVSSVLYFSARAHEIAVDGVWALLFSANWRFLIVGTDYFGQSSAPSPLQHYWSLAVEEQFYFVWPWLLLVALLLLARVRRSRSALIGSVVVAVLLVATFAWSVHQSTVATTAAYFSTFTRAWELLAGAALALVATRLTGLPRIARLVLGWGGLLTIVVSALFVHAGTGFPAPMGLLPILGTVAVIAAGTGTLERSTLTPLTNPLSRYLGRISYSLYLWHWPAIILLVTFLSVDRKLYRAIAVLLALGLSVLTFHLVEEPIRHSRWLERRSARPDERPAQQRPRTQWRLVGVGALAVAVAVAGTLAVQSTIRDAQATPPAVAQTPATTLSTDSDAAAHVTEQLQLAVAATAWPALTPAIDALPQSKAPELEDLACANDWDTIEQHCVYGDPAAPRTAALVGDSTALAWLPGLRAALEPAGWNIDSYGKWGCPAASTPVHALGADPYPACETHLDWVLARVAAQQPELVVLGSAEGYVDNLPSGATADQASAEWTAGIERSIRAVAGPGTRVVVLASPPYGKDLTQCATRSSPPSACLSEVSAQWQRTSAAEVAAVDAARADGLDVQYVDSHGWFCTAEGTCPGFSDGIVIRADTNHVTANYATYLAPLLREGLQVG